MHSLDILFFKMQAQIIELNLQLAEAEEKPKRSGDFETTYKNESGKEIVVKRSPDGKFASKSGNANTAVAPKLSGVGALDPQVARENGKAVREILTGKTGDDLKKDLAAEFNHRPIIKEAIEKVDFAEVAKGDADALTNISRFMSKNFEQAFNASSMLARETLGVAVAVAGFVARSLMYSAAFGATLILGSAGIGVFKKGMRPDKALIEQTSTIAPAVLKSMFSKKSLISRIRWGVIVEGVFRSLDIASEELGKNQPPIVEPTADEAVVEAMRGISGNALKNNLMVSAAQTPGVAEGIKSTKIEEVIKGDKDVFSNAANFLRNKIDEAASAVSDHKKEIAIGGSILSLGICASILGAALGITSSAAVIDTVVGLVTGKGLTEVAKTALKKLTTGQFNQLSTQQLSATAAAILLKSRADKVIREEIEKERIRKTAKTQGAKTFGAKEEVVKKLIVEEELDYEAVLRAIARRKEEPPNPKKAEQLQKEIISIRNEIADGERKAKAIVADKTRLSIVDSTGLVAIAKKETELRNILIEKRGVLAIAEGRGFSLQKRFDELTEIEKTEGRQSPSYKWRASIIKAEIEYGAQLDNLDSAEGYNELMNAMKKSVPASGKYTSISSTDSAKLYNFFVGNMSTPKTPIEKQEVIVKQAQEEGMILQDYLNTPIVAQVGLEGGMTCAIPGGNNKYSQITRDIARGNSFLEPLIQTETFNNKKVDGFINIGDAVVELGGQKLQGYNATASSDEHIREMMWHESGHILEVKLGKVEESVALREERSNEVPADRKEIPQKGINLGAPDFALGDFYSPYVGLRMKGQGKYKDQDTATEVLSSGMELLSSPTLAKRGVKADRETMLYALAAMNEKVKE